MNKTKTILASLLMTFGMAAQADNVMTAEDVIIEPGQTAELHISLQNDFDVAYFGFNLYLPEGIRFAYDDDEEDYVYGYSDRVPTTNKGKPRFKAEFTNTADGSLLCAFNSGTGGYVLDGTSGEVITLTLEADSEINQIVYEGKLGGGANLCISNADGTQSVVLPEVTFNILVGTAVGIRNINADGTGESVYNLGGQRVTTPSKGIYVKNGQKVVVR